MDELMCGSGMLKGVLLVGRLAWRDASRSGDDRWQVQFEGEERVRWDRSARLSGYEWLPCVLPELAVDEGMTVELGGRGVVSALGRTICALVMWLLAS